MADNDRAAKAARAKALLAKKRQQKKAADSVSGAITPSTSASPAIPARTLSPAPSEPSASTPVNEESNRDLADVFSQDSNANDDSSWLSSLPRATPPPPSRVTSTSPPVPHKAPTPSILSTTSTAVERPDSPHHKDTTVLQDKINQLETLNATLQAEAKHLRGLLEASRKAESLLAAEKERAASWQQKYSDLEKEKAALLAEEAKRFSSLQEDSKRMESLLLEEKARADHLQKSLTNLEKEKESALATERQTISLLVSEKAALTSELEKREDAESKLQAMEAELDAATTHSNSLQQQLLTTQTEVDDALQKLNHYQAREKELTERSRDLERQLQASTTAANESRKEAEDVNRRLQELTEQIQTDDRVERLEQSLKHSQDRADELEFQLSKLRQSQTSLKVEKDELAARCGKYEADDAKTKSRLSEVEAQLSTLEEKYKEVSKERDSLAQKSSSLRELEDTSKKTIADLQEKLVQASSAVATHTRQMQALQNELKNAVKRAEESEKTTRNLQQEGTNLMRSVDEMRPKIVELTDAKLDLSEKVSSLERAVAARDRAIADLEASLDALQDEKGEAATKLQQTLSQKDKDYADLQKNFAELQKGYGELQEELDTALASVKTLEAQRSSHHQDVARRLEEIDRLSANAQSQEEELANLRHELEQRHKVQEEEQNFLENAQNEMEALRNELEAREQEIESLREAASPTGAPRSLDDEMVSSLRQQHALDLSNAQSTIRALEDTIFERDAKIHGLQKQLAGLQEQISRLQAAARQQPPRSFSPINSRPSSRHDTRRSISTRPSAVPPPLSRTVFDQALSAETMHKRKVSLSMLKARIESERSSTAAGVSPLVHSRALSPVHSLSGKEDDDAHSHHSHSTHHHHQPSHPVVHRPQFLDESHVFWCHSCQGDLVIL